MLGLLLVVYYRADEMRLVNKELICLDVQTRWNAIYVLLGAALYEKVVEWFEDQDLAFIYELKEGVIFFADQKTKKRKVY